jgi:hypothetical protein
MVFPVASISAPGAHGESRQAHPIAHALADEAIRTGGSLSEQTLRYLERIAVGVETLPERIALALETLAANGSPAIQPGNTTAKVPRKRHSRGAKRKDAEGDRKIYEAWMTDHYKTYAECGREFGRDGRYVRRALGRYRKYLERNPGKS